jgi:hypothetical protein
MSKVIRLRDDTFRRLQALSEPFITPDTAINVLLDELDKLREPQGRFRNYPRCRSQVCPLQYPNGLRS